MSKKWEDIFSCKTEMLVYNSVNYVLIFICYLLNYRLLITPESTPVKLIENSKFPSPRMAEIVIPNWMAQKSIEPHSGKKKNL